MKPSVLVTSRIDPTRTTTFSVRTDGLVPERVSPRGALSAATFGPDERAASTIIRHTARRTAAGMWR